MARHPHPVRSERHPRSSGRRPRGFLLAAVVLALVHFGWLAAHRAPAIFSPDANGYVAQARWLAEEGRTGFTTTSPVQHVGMHWLETPGGVFRSRYPAGLPVLQAGAWKLGGLNAALWLNPLLASATVLLTFLLARRFAPEPYALLAALAVATVPVANQHALDADAHTAAAFFLVAGILALDRFVFTRAPAMGLLAGVLLGAVPTVRYPEALAGVAVGAWLLWRVRPWWRLWPTVAGAALPIGALLVHNAVVYGAFWRTGYALTGEQTGFGLRYLLGHAVPYLQALGGQGLTLFFAFGVAGLAAMAFDERRRVEGRLFAGLVVPLVLLYMAYYFGGGGPGGAMGNLRFLIPTFPFFAVAGGWLLARLADRLGAPGRAAACAVAGVQLLVGLVGSQQQLGASKTALTAAACIQVLAQREIPAGSVVIVDRQLAESLDAVGRWNLVEESLVAGFGPGGNGPRGPGGMGAGPGRPAGGVGWGDRPADVVDQPDPMQRGKNRAQLERYAGLRPEERRRRVWEDVKAWAGEKPVFWLARSRDLADEVLPPAADYRVVTEVEAPALAGFGGGPGAVGPQGPGGPGRGAMAGPRPMPGPGGMGPGRGDARAGMLHVLRLQLPAR